MTTQEAHDIGRTKTLKATSIPVIAYLFVLMVTETRGDFSNGILFFFSDIFEIHFIVIMTILFGLTLLFGRMAGKEIIIDKKKLLTTSIKYSVIIVFAVSIYIPVIGIILGNQNSVSNEQKHILEDFLTPFIKTVALIILPVMLSWIWATNQMKKYCSEEK